MLEHKAGTLRGNQTALLAWRGQAKGSEVRGYICAVAKEVGGQVAALVARASLWENNLR